MDTQTRASLSRCLKASHGGRGCCRAHRLGDQHCCGIRRLEFVAGRKRALGSDVGECVYCGGPVFLVAVVELTKIPLSGAAYCAGRWYWKMLFGFGLCFVAFITFETMFNGFERNFASLKQSMDLKMDEYYLQQERLADRQAELALAEGLTLDSIQTGYNERFAAINKDFDQSIAAVDGKYESQRRAASDEFIEERRADKERLAAEISEVKARHSVEMNQELDRVAQEFTRDEASLKNKRDGIQRRYDALSDEIEGYSRQLADMGFFSSGRSALEANLESAKAQRDLVGDQLDEAINERPVSAVQTARDLLILRHDSELAPLIAQLEKVSAELDDALSKQRDALSNLETEISKEKDPLLKKREEQVAELDSWLALQLLELENLAATKSGLNEEITLLAAAITELRGQINSEGRGNQVYRMAASFYDKDNIAELSPSQTASVATAWFGSLALIVACAGILLAFGSYAVKTPPKEKRDYRELVRYTRMLIAAIKLQKRKPREVEVVKEVEVIKKIEVPGPERIVDREVKVREEVYIPVPATPSQFEALMKAEKEGFAEDIAA